MELRFIFVTNACQQKEAGNQYQNLFYDNPGEDDCKVKTAEGLLYEKKIS